MRHKLKAKKITEVEIWNRTVSWPWAVPSDKHDESVMSCENIPVEITQHDVDVCMFATQMVVWSNTRHSTA